MVGARNRRLRSARGATAGLLGLTTALVWAAPLALGGLRARADQIFTESSSERRGYTAVEELSYEAIVAPGQDYGAELRVRIALHNGSAEAQDFVEHIALPATAELVGMRVARGGDWSEHLPTQIHSQPVERRVPGAIFARSAPPTRDGGPAAAEVIGFDIEAGATVQVELILSVQPRLRNDRWHLDLPRRGDQNVLARQRRVLVVGLDSHEEFWVDDAGSAGAPYMVSRPDDVVTVSWPAHVRGGALLDGRLDFSPDPFGDGGRFRVLLRLGDTRPITPDHVTLVVDRSKSTSASLQRDTAKLADQIFAHLDPATSFDALAFDRAVTPLLADASEAATTVQTEETSKTAAQSTRHPTVDDPQARGELARALDTDTRGQGTDLEAALRAAARRLRGSNARRPTIVVITDGMLPRSIDGALLRRELAADAGRKRPPELIFVIDDPILARRGLGPDHPAARTAASLGARISLRAVANLRGGDGREIFAAPRVLGDLQLVLPRGAELDEAPPEGLVAGSFALLEGSYERRAPRTLTVRGVIDGRRVSARLAGRSAPRYPEALAAATAAESREAAAAEGFAAPAWYDRSMTEHARARIARSGAQTDAPEGEVTDQIFHWYLRRRVLPRVRTCYNGALSRHQLQGGSVTLEMEVGKGEVMLARVAASELDVPDDKLLACLHEAAWALEVPAASLDTRIYTLRYPITLRPPEGGKAPSASDGNDPFVDMLVEQADILAR